MTEENRERRLVKTERERTNQRKRAKGIKAEIYFITIIIIIIIIIIMIIIMIIIIIII